MFSKVLLAAALIGSTFANPLPSDNKTPVARRASVPADDACMVKDGLGFNSVEVYATKDSMPIDQVCGQGYLDNFRGRCGTITDWGCMFVDENVNKVEEKEKNEDQVTGAKMTFKTQAFCSSSDIIEAMGAASAADGKKPSRCVESEKWMLP
jgi:hypothetical protein